MPSLYAISIVLFALPPLFALMGFLTQKASFWGFAAVLALAAAVVAVFAELSYLAPLWVAVATIFVNTGFKLLSPPK